MLKVVEIRKGDQSLNQIARDCCLIEYHNISKSNFTLNKRGAAIAPRIEQCCLCKKQLLSSALKNKPGEFILFLGCHHNYHKDCYGAELPGNSGLFCKLCLYWNKK